MLVVWSRHDIALQHCGRGSIQSPGDAQKATAQVPPRNIRILQAMKRNGSTGLWTRGSVQRYVQAVSLPDTRRSIFVKSSSSKWGRPTETASSAGNAPNAYTPRRGGCSSTSRLDARDECSRRACMHRYLKWEGLANWHVGALGDRTSPVQQLLESTRYALRATMIGDLRPA